MAQIFEFFSKNFKTEIFLEFDFLFFWYIFMYFVTYGRKYWADIMFWISWFCSLLLVKWPIFGQLFGLISQKATTGWFSFWLFSAYLCMYFMKLKWFFMVHDLFETEASQPLWWTHVGFVMSLGMKEIKIEVGNTDTPRNKCIVRSTLGLFYYSGFWIIRIPNT